MPPYCDMNRSFDPALITPEYIKNILPYIPSAPDPELMKRFGVTRLHRLNNNENPLGPAPAARRVLDDFESGRASIYPSGDSWYLSRALAEKFGKEPEQFLVGNGSNEAITCVIKAFCEQGDNIVTADRTYATYEWVAEFSGIEPRLVPLDADYRFDLDAMLRAADGRTKIFFICNPNNPTNRWLRAEELRRFIEAAGNRIVVIDEAYCEFVDDPDFPDAMKLMEEYDNVVCFRTFSKMYGLAALRVGYLCGSRECIDMARRAYVVYSVNTLGQAAAAAAVTDDAEHIARTRALVKESGAFALERMKALGLETVNGPAFFMMVRLPCSDTAMYRRLMKRGVMVRTMTGFRFPNWIRVTFSTVPVMRDFADALEASLGGR